MVDRRPEFTLRDPGAGSGRRLTLAVALALSLVALGSGCGDPAVLPALDLGGDGPPPVLTSDATGIDPDLPAGQPVWTDAPDRLELEQGRPLRVPLTITDPDGDPVTVTPEAVPAGLEVTVSADGTALTVRAGYQLQGASLFAVTLDDGRGAPVTMDVQVEVTPVRWQATPAWTGATGPAAREHGSMVVDADGRRAFLIGGSAYDGKGTGLDDVWEYDLGTSTWSELTTAIGDARPVGAGSRRPVQIPGQPVAYLLGGYGTGGSSNAELWRFSFEGEVPTFTVVEQDNPPPDRALHAFAYDPVSQRFAAFGGFGSTGVLGDTWIGQLEGDRMVWTEAPGPGPSARYGFFFGTDEVAGRLLLFSGAQGTVRIDPARDTWALDLRAETPQWSRPLDGEADGVPPGRRNGCHVFDPTGPRLWVFGGTADGRVTEEGLFVLDARPGQEVWDRLDLGKEPPLRSSGFGFFDPVSGQVYLGFGNTTEALYADFTTLRY